MLTDTEYCETMQPYKICCLYPLSSLMKGTGHLKLWAIQIDKVSFMNSGVKQ